ncbi:hypothetical protein [Nonomuraea angiospora]|uniref:hypothetical protein n=1 Tax=Nonomuraea angiospora TaxID=46172 RepID=UPI0029AE6D7E|nr:hypothetical protein [Nonomuraea angiospora]MDX3101739.1 hypothetical protein [Nonomuraea angiospora]
MSEYEPALGPVETAVRGDVDALDVSGAMARSLAASAFNLARKLDGDAGMATAAVARELRETLKALAEAAGDDDGSDLVAELSPQVGDAPQP